MVRAKTFIEPLPGKQTTSARQSECWAK